MTLVSRLLKSRAPALFGARFKPARSIQTRRPSRAAPPLVRTTTRRRTLSLTTTSTKGLLLRFIPPCYLYSYIQVSHHGACEYRKYGKTEKIDFYFEIHRQRSVVSHLSLAWLFSTLRFRSSNRLYWTTPAILPTLFNSKLHLNAYRN